MVNRYSLLVLSCMALPVQLLQARSIESDRINGVILGAALGDALGRVTMPLDTTHDMKMIYGKGGVTSIDKFTKSDWILDGKKGKKAPYASNTVLSLLALDVLADARQSSADKEAMAEQIAGGLLQVFGEAHRTWDPHFDSRYYSMSDLERGEQLIERKNTKSNPWWDATEEDISPEADSGALSRAWPVGVVYADHISSARYYADYLTTITHRHPTARAAASALVTGIVHALHGATVDEMVDHMISAAEKFDRLERLEKTKARKISNFATLDPEVIAVDRMLTSDMIRYAAYAAKKGKSPEEILGTNSKHQDSGRSYRGFLLGYQADEAVAAAVYLIVRNPENLKAIFAEGSFAGGNSALITSLAGAFSGARYGLSGIKKQGFRADLAALESARVSYQQGFSADHRVQGNITALHGLSASARVEKSLQFPGKLYENKGEQKKFEEQIEKYRHKRSSSTLRNLVILGAPVIGAYLVKEYVVPRVRSAL